MAHQWTTRPMRFLPAYWQMQRYPVVKRPLKRCDLKERTMLDHMILTVSDVERSLAFYQTALKPLNIKFFLPYKGEGESS
jgi:hypothetical protein